jgi:hypothetical protein
MIFNSPSSSLTGFSSQPVILKVHSTLLIQPSPSAAIPMVSSPQLTVVDDKNLAGNVAGLIAGMNMDNFTGTNYPHSD